MSIESSFKDEKEIAHFAKDSNAWWDVNGPFAPLHKMHPARMEFIVAQIKSHLGADSLKGLSALDVACGGGLVSESLARLGADVTGVDLDEQALAVAKDHAAASGLSIDYQLEPVESLQAQYDVVLALEVAEHVLDVEGFIAACAARVKPGGLLVVSTLNRTAQSFLGGIIAAEYLLRWVPQGTHDWKKFIKPAEMSSFMHAARLDVQEASGVAYKPLLDKFVLSPAALHINYLLSATKPLG